MKAVVCDGFGGVEVMRVDDLPDPVPGEGQLLVRVRASALNRADTLQRAGGYAPPPGESQILGIEISGEVVGQGPGVAGFSRGDRVFGLVGSGGYAELCLLDAGMAVRMPDGWSFVQAAAVPEVFYTADTTLFELGELAAGQTVLVHAGGSGVGTACIQLARAIGARSFVTCGTDDKIQRCLALGADAGINYRTHDFADEVMRLTAGEGVDVVEDFLGAEYLARNLSILKPGGRLVQVGLITGHETPVDLLPIVLRRLQIKGSSMRPRPLADKRAITETFRRRWLPLLVSGALVGVVDSVFPLDEVSLAHGRMEANLNFGKILLTM